MWKQSVKDISGDILCVSQFTLLANTTKGSKPDFHRAMGAETSRTMYASFLERLGALYSPERIKGMQSWLCSCQTVLNFITLDGRFGAMMNVSLTNEVSSLPTAPVN